MLLIKPPLSNICLFICSFLLYYFSHLNLGQLFELSSWHFPGAAMIQDVCGLMHGALITHFFSFSFSLVSPRAPSQSQPDPEARSHAQPCLDWFPGTSAGWPLQTWPRYRPPCPGEGAGLSPGGEDGWMDGWMNLPPISYQPEQLLVGGLVWIAPHGPTHRPKRRENIPKVSQQTHAKKEARQDVICISHPTSTVPNWTLFLLSSHTHTHAHINKRCLPYDANVHSRFRPNVLATHGLVFMKLTNNANVLLIRQ